MVYTPQTGSRRHVLCGMLFAVFFTLMACPQSAGAAPERYSLSHRPADTPTCQLIWAPGGQTALDGSQVTDPGLQATLREYDLNCSTAYAECMLTQTQVSGNPNLDLSNVQGVTSLAGLTTPTQYYLNCQGTAGDTAPVNANGRQSCSLMWGTSGTPLNSDSSDMSGTLKGNYSLDCSSDTNQPTACSLILGTYGDTLLNLANIQSTSPWIYAKLYNHYSLSCGSSDKAAPFPNLVDMVAPIPVFCDSDGSAAQNEGDYTTVWLGATPTCDHVTWTFGTNEKGKTCTFAMQWYGGDPWTMDFYTNSGNPSYRTYAVPVNSSAPLNVAEADIAYTTVEMPTMGGSITNGVIDVAPIAVTNCQ